MVININYLFYEAMKPFSKMPETQPKAKPATAPREISKTGSKISNVEFFAHLQNEIKAFRKK